MSNEAYCNSTTLAGKKEKGGVGEEEEKWGNGVVALLNKNFGKKKKHTANHTRSSS